MPQVPLIHWKQESRAVYTPGPDDASGLAFNLTTPKDASYVNQILLPVMQAMLRGATGLKAKVIVEAFHVQVHHEAVLSSSAQWETPENQREMERQASHGAASAA
mmetsp:Transcript_117709/g.216687  ORF Transcript_117709/g.216687 Transcript_117709/m.216687 type:complete len:105 (-) Transcript_117709:674-988(-)